MSEIGPPPITSKQRAAGTRLRNKCRNNLGLFNSEVFPNSTGLKEKKEGGCLAFAEQPPEAESRQRGE
jgi:hypothetical protein